MIPHKKQKGLLYRMAAPLRTVNTKHAVKPVNGVIYWHINESNMTDDMSKKEILVSFERGFRLLERGLFHPLKFKPTSDPRKAPIHLFFKNNGDKGLPQKFDKGVLAYAFLPAGNPLGYQSDVYFNDAISWKQMHSPGHFSLVAVFVHEVLHALGLHHSSVKNDIMYPTYQKGGRIEFTDDSRKAVDKLYGNYKEAITPPKPTHPHNPIVPVAPKPPVVVTDIQSFLSGFFLKHQLIRMTPEQLVSICHIFGVEADERTVTFRQVWKVLGL